MSPHNADFAVNLYSYTMSHTARDAIASLARRGYVEFELMAYPGHLWPADCDAAARRELRRFAESGKLTLATINTPNIDLNVAGASPAVLAEIGFKRRPTFAIATPDPDRGIDDSVRRLVDMAWRGTA